MNSIFENYYKEEIKEKKRLSGGITFDTFLITLNSGRKVVLRTSVDHINNGGRKMIIGDIFKKEKFFFDSVRNKIGVGVPDNIIVDDSMKLYRQSFMMYDYIEGDPMDTVLETRTLEKQGEIYREVGRICARINNCSIDREHELVKKRGAWGQYVSNRLRERLNPFLCSSLINGNEIDRLVSILKNTLNGIEYYSFLHMDLRLNNLIMRDDEIVGLIDSESMEFGDPLFEFARLLVGGAINHYFIEGYREYRELDIDNESLIYKLYRMEAVAFLANVFINDIESGIEVKDKWEKEFTTLKESILLQADISGQVTL